MYKLNWDSSFSVNNDDLDHHHKNLINLFNTMATLVENEQDAPLFSTIKVISELNIYAIYHFKEEEALMKAANYPGLAEHKVLHQEFIDHVTKFKEEYMHNDTLLNFEIFNYLSDWIIKHILIEDSKYDNYI